MSAGWWRRQSGRCTLRTSLPLFWRYRDRRTRISRTLSRPDKPDYRADGVDEFRAGVEVRTHHRGGFVDARDAVPCAKAEAVTATRSAAERISFCLLFLFINCSCFVPSKGWMVLCRAVDTRLLFFGLVGCPFVSTDLGVSVADRLYLVPPCAWVMPSYVFIFILF